MAIYSRLRRYEEKKQRTKLVLSLVGSVGILAFLAIFGLRLLVGFSLLVDRIRGGSPQPTPIAAGLLLPPVLNPPPQATNSAVLTISGRATENSSVILYVNDREEQKTKVEEDGTFTFESVVAQEGKNTISSKAINEKGAISELSNVLVVYVKRKPPILELTSPDNDSVKSGENTTVTVAGKVEDNATISINDRLVVVRSDGSFSYDFPLQEGTTVLKIIATDEAGNQTTIERTVTYKK